jgi:hypothetical protein
MLDKLLISIYMKNNKRKFKTTNPMVRKSFFAALALVAVITLGFVLLSGRPTLVQSGSEVLGTSCKVTGASCLLTSQCCVNNRCQWFKCTKCLPSGTANLSLDSCNKNCCKGCGTCTSGADHILRCKCF